MLSEIYKQIRCQKGFEQSLKEGQSIEGQEWDMRRKNAIAKGEDFHESLPPRPRVQAF